MKNHFAYKTTAERYKKGRPYFHKTSIGKVKDRLQLNNQKLDKILDIACGTGLSTQALIGLGNEIYGTDISEEMLVHARTIEGIQFLKSPGESQPFDDDEFEMITVSSGVHWFDIPLFLKECYRLLKDQQWLIIYDNFFLGKMKDEPLFSNWLPSRYLKKYPSPPRNNQFDWSNENLAKYGFEFIEEERYENEVLFSQEDLKLYFTTQSNISHQINNNQISYKEIEAWLDNELAPFFEEKEKIKILFYGNWIKYLRKI